ncbi:sensor histidine kinase [Paenibacillus sp. PR3]|uniref:histidine kinase n=1 Tax=Paenibacillus terricola TaxID=2763503 RepID=A0ABR8N507_9BACL|nr:sensor histidine kinase [Paenibacillus terricola]MBD3921544.1 sensor histidine kinase [Paenibacillus terricola]
MQALLKRLWDRPAKLRNRLIFVFSWIVLFIVLIPTLISYRQSTQTLRQQYIDSHRQIVKLIHENISSYAAQIDELSLSPRKDEQFMNALYGDSYTERMYIQNELRNLFYSRNDIETLSIYTPINGLNYVASRSFVNIKVEENPSISHEPWYQKAASGPRFLSIEPGGVTGELTSHGDRPFLVYHRMIINIADRKPIASVSITLNRSELDKIASELSEDSEAIAGLFNEEGASLALWGTWSQRQLEAVAAASLQREKLDLEANPSEQSVQQSLPISGVQTLLLSNTLPRTGWTLATLTPQSVLKKDAAKVRTFNLMLGIGLFIVFLIIVSIVANAITGRLKQLSIRIGRLGDGNFNVIPEVAGNDEIAGLSRKYNQMVLRIDELIREKYESRLNERNAQLKALEAQINPHFLYNALQAISTKAIMGNNMDIYDMVEALAAALRYGIKEADIVKLEDELAHVENYLMIQKARFGERLNVEYEIASGIGRSEIPKMSLQILVENAIKHGLEQMSEPATIRIEAAVIGHFLTFAVHDNGPGITPERLMQVRERLARENLAEYGEGIGLNNVYTRIRLMYGEEAQLLIDSRQGEWTSVAVRLPLTEEENETNV